MLLCKRPVAKRLIQSMQHKTIMILLVDYGVKLKNVDMTKILQGVEHRIWTDCKNRLGVEEK
jgi:hypothetical protein